MEKLKLLYAGINLKEFCEKYGLSYDYTRKVFKGTYELSKDKENEYLECFAKWHEEKNKILFS